MPDDRPSLEGEVRGLSRSVEALTDRVEALERALEPLLRVAARREAAERGEPPPEVKATLSATARAMPFLGRLLLVLGGAWLLRSVTEGFEGRTQRLMGVAVGLAYGFTWLLAAWRAAGRDARDAATWHGLAASLIAFPLLWETSSRFGLLSPEAAAALLVLITTGGLFASWRHGLRALAWVFVLGADLVGLAMIVPSAPAAAPFFAALVVVGAAALWVGRSRSWPGLRAVSALAADLGAAVLVYHALASTSPTPQVAMLLLLFLLVAYVGSTATYLLRGWWRLDGLDVGQGALALGLGLGGALHVGQATGASCDLICTSAVALGGLLYVMAFTVLERDRRRRFYYLTSVALVLVLLGCASLLAAPAWPWALLAVASTLLAHRYGRMTLGLHATAYAVAAAAASGLVALATHAWVGSATGTFPTLAPAGALTLAALALSAARPAPHRSEVGARVTAWAQAILLALLAFTGGGALLAGLVALWPHAESGGVDAGWLAVVRTALLSLLTLGAALAAHRPALASAGPLVAPLLVAGAAKLALEDLTHGRPVTLAVSFALYGTVLMTAPRLRRSARAPRPGPPPAGSAPPSPEPSPPSA